MFPGAQHVRGRGLETADDLGIWEHAKAHRLTIVSHDVDFANLGSVRGHPPKVIWLRCGNQPTSVIENLLRRHCASITAFAQDAEMECLEIFS